MKIKNEITVIAALTVCALAPLTRGQCPQSCNGQNTALGDGALPNATSSAQDTAIGFEALLQAKGARNTALGYHAGNSITTATDNTIVGNEAGATSTVGLLGSFSTAVGSEALNSSGDNNTAVGYQAIFTGSTGAGNTAVGTNAMVGDFNSDTSGSNNTAVGFNALALYTTANNNTAIGYQALDKNQTGNDNVATGRGALFNDTASNNTADGSQALNKNTTGTDNVAIGRTAMFNNTTGSDNVALGRGALNANTTASQNTACGYKALNNSTGANNTAVGYEALFADTLGLLNTASGREALFANTTGFGNSALGDEALLNNTTGFDNIGIGIAAGSALTTGGNNIEIGNAGLAGEGSTIRVGTNGTQTNTYIAGINGVTVAGGIGVIIDSNGHLGTSTSSARYKDNIQPMEKTSEAILSLQPVTFRYRKELDPKAIPQFGLVAEQVEKVDPELVARDESGKPYAVRYEAVNAMLLNEFLKEHRKVEKLEARMGEQEEQFQKTVAELQAALKAQAAQIQKVSVQMSMIKPSPRLVVYNQ